MNVAHTEGNGRRPGRQGRPDPSGPGQRLTVGSLFAGIGGFDLGLERAGMRTLWFCEQDPFCQRVLARHWPGVPCHLDVRALVADTEGSARRRREVSGAGGNGRSGLHGEEGSVSVSVPYVDVLCGGFPCQDISLAGRGAGLAGERSGLWREFARLIGELRPRYVIVENVPALTSRGLDVVLSDLAACGLDAEWDHLPASAFGAPHRRDRIWLVAYPGGGELRQQPGRGSGPSGTGQALAGVNGAARAVADAERPRLEGHGGNAGRAQEPEPRNGRALADPSRHGAEEQAPAGTFGERARASRERSGGAIDWWLAEPDVGRVAHGIPARVDRLRALGNSLVPQIAEWIGRQILEWERLAA